VVLDGALPTEDAENCGGESTLSESQNGETSGV
jgi:hypothetical protein